MAVAAALLALILSLLCGTIQNLARSWLDGPMRLSIAAAALASLFCAAAVWYHALSWPLAAMMFGYVLAPILLVAAKPRDGTARILDLLAILALWLPLEFAAGAVLVPRPVQGVLHAIAYGIAVTLALLVFLVWQRFDGMKYNLPQRLSDLGNVAAGFLCAAVILIPIGLAVGFLSPAHAPRMSLGTAAIRAALIFAGTALPEEILFRSLIQNWLTRRLGGSNSTIALSALVFGLAHLNNAPGPLPNWRYAIVATLAGFLFGKVFQRSSSVLASALVHAAVNTVKHLFF
ncbi:MAG: type II CAAX prenyl endopeptidase Rce1 family protein [Bryobacteraceae bacterium]